MDLSKNLDIIYSTASGKEWLSKVEESENKNLLVMFSGGKDSAFCLGLLKTIGLNVEAIHFKNRWTWKLSTEEAKRISKIFGVKLNVCDITKEFSENIEGKIRGRPCTQCKTIMDAKAVEYCLDNGFEWICEGDNALDSSIKKIRNYESKRNNTNLFVTRYLDCVEMGIEIPEKIKVLRPLIEMKPDTIERALKDIFEVKIRKNHETGDKQGQYWREGCPLQYADQELILTAENMDSLFMINSEATRYARKRSFRTSVYLPSKRIVTIPNGFEDDIREHLKTKVYNI
jgi:7-cyano-7-deazaguanine synthase in queuosine biosynthesis